MIKRAVILAAGQGKRMRPLTYYRPKPLVPVAGRPIIEHIVVGLANAGVREICLVIGYRGDQIIEALDDGRRFGVRRLIVGRNSSTAREPPCCWRRSS